MSNVIPTKLLLAKSEAQRLLDEFDRPGDDLASALSHELRTPLTSIIGFSELLLKNPAMDEDRRTEYLRYIHDEGVRLSELVSAIVSDVLVAERSRGSR